MKLAEELFLRGKKSLMFLIFTLSIICRGRFNTVADALWRLYLLFIRQGVRSELSGTIKKKK